MQRSDTSMLFVRRPDNVQLCGVTLNKSASETVHCQHTMTKETCFCFCLRLCQLLLLMTPKSSAWESLHHCCASRCPDTAQYTGAWCAPAGTPSRRPGGRQARRLCRAGHAERAHTSLQAAGTCVAHSNF